MSLALKAEPFVNGYSLKSMNKKQRFFLLRGVQKNTNGLGVAKKIKLNTEDI